MKKSLWVLLIAVALTVIIFSWFKSGYNNMVSKSEAVKAQWGNVETQYQRRADLIPNLVSTVKGYATHEQSTFEAVTEARSKATQMQVTFDDLNEENLAKFNKAQGDLTSALGRLLAISENYPDLKASQNFRDLQTQLEGTENRIATERRRFNEQVQDYNTYIMMFPRNILALMFNFVPKAYFAADTGAAEAPKVDF